MTSRKTSATYRSRLGKLPLLLLLAWLPAALLPAQSIQEESHFRHIVELSGQSGAYLDEALSEMDSFRSQYPSSGHHLQLEFLRAKIALEKRDYALSQELFAQLLKQDLPPDILAGVYLNHAISSYYSQDYQQALQLLDGLKAITNSEFFAYQSHIWRGRIQASQGFYLTAELEYVLALQDDPEEVRFDHFLLLLKLDRFEEASAVFASTTREQMAKDAYLSSWLSYLLSHRMFEEFDACLSGQRLSWTTPDDGIRLLQVRKALEMEDYPGASAWLDSLATESDTRTYYQALLSGQAGDHQKADSLLASLAGSRDRELPYLAYLERLKLLFRKDPEAAIRQLENHLQSNDSKRGDAYHLLGVFNFDQKSYAAALQLFFEASDRILDPLQAERNDIYSALAYHASRDDELSLHYFNRYLNLHPNGKYRDLALYHLGYVYYLQSDFPAAATHLEKLLSQYPQSDWKDEAKYYLAELRFQGRDYAAAAALLNDIALSPSNHKLVFLRLGQAFYYQEKYGEALQVLENLADNEIDFDTMVLLAGIHFSLKDYETALATYQKAGVLASTSPQLTEALSYRANTLYYMQRYEEASRLFFELAMDTVNPDTYLYQAAKAASQGRQWQRALDLYGRFMDDYPESGYILQAQADLANALFNLGSYDTSLEYWLNLLRRFSSHTFISQEEQPLLNEVFAGIEMNARRLEGNEHIGQIEAMLDSFKSEYVKFELEYILVKLYANAGLWEELLQEAAELRENLSLPQARRNDVELLMLDSLIGLNQMAQADSLAGAVYKSTGSQPSLVKWAQLAALSGKAGLALDRYLEAFRLKPEADLWLDMLDFSEKNGYLRFSEIWDLGSAYRGSFPQARLSQMQFLVHREEFDDAAALADSILAVESNPWYRAKASFWLGRIALARHEGEKAVNIFGRIRLLYPELSDLQAESTYYYILSLLDLGAAQEARQVLAEAEELLSEEQKSDIQARLDERR